MKRVERVLNSFGKYRLSSKNNSTPYYTTLHCGIAAIALSHDMSLCVVEHTVLLHVEYAIDDELLHLVGCRIIEDIF